MDVPCGTISRLVDDSDAVIEKLSVYEREIRKWNPKINLVSPKTLDQLWERHFVDSLQLAQYVPRGTIRALDVGSGGGFPALVLAAALPETQWTLVESDQRKGVFLRTAARAMDVNVDVKTTRIENLPEDKFDLISARALADLNQFLEWTAPFAQQDAVFLFPKGKSWESELTQAQQNWQMEVESFSSQTDTEARILRLSQVKRS